MFKLRKNNPKDKSNLEKSRLDLNGNGPYKVTRSDGTLIMKFESFDQALKFSTSLNNLYKFNEVRDISKVVSD